MAEQQNPCGCGCLPLKQKEVKKRTTVEAVESPAKTEKEEKKAQSKN